MYNQTNITPKKMYLVMWNGIGLALNSLWKWQEPKVFKLSKKPSSKLEPLNLKVFKKQKSLNWEQRFLSKSKTKQH
jgi:hypothetical protein